MDTTCFYSSNIPSLVARKAIRDNFKVRGYNHHDCFVKWVELGKTLEMVIKDYLKLHIEDPETHTLGPNKYAAWRILLGKPSSSTSGSLVVKHKTDSVPACLDKAGQELTKRGGRAKFVQAMTLIKDADINQRVVKGIFSGFLSISCNASPAQLHCAVSIIQWIDKKGIKERFADEFGHVRDHVNDVLCSVIWGSNLFQKCV